MVKVNGELTLLLFMFVVSILMFSQTDEFPQSAALLPSVTALLTIGLVATLLGYRALPSHVKESIPDTSRSIEVVDDMEETMDRGDSGSSKIARQAINDSPFSPMHKRIILSSLIILYAISGYLIGILWTTPLFVVACSVLFSISLRKTIALVLISIAIVYVFMYLLNVDMASGLFTGGSEIR